MLKEFILTSHCHLVSIEAYSLAQVFRMLCAYIDLRLWRASFQNIEVSHISKLNTYRQLVNRNVIYRAELGAESAFGPDSTVRREKLCRIWVFNLFFLPTGAPLFQGYI